MRERKKIHPTAQISKSASLGKDVEVGAFTVIEDGVEIGEGSTIGPHCILGEPSAEYYASSGEKFSNPPTRIGAGAILRSHSVIYSDVQIGEQLRAGHHVVIREKTKIGKNFQVGTFSDIQGLCSIGDYVRFHSGVFVPHFTTIGDYVWLFPGVSLLNDPHPPSDVATKGATIDAYAVIGANSVILAALHIGTEAVVAAGSVVTRDVPAGEIVVGSPAKSRGKASEVVKSRSPELDRPYPWRRHFSRGYPWEKKG